MKTMIKVLLTQEDDYWGVPCVGARHESTTLECGNCTNLK